MSTEFYTDKTPMYVHNKHTTYENTVLNIISSIISGLSNTNEIAAVLDVQGPLYIGLCLKGGATEFIEENFETYYTEEEAKITTDNSANKKAAARTKTWVRLMIEAQGLWMDKYKIDGSKAKIAVIDDYMDGDPCPHCGKLLPRKIVDAQDTPYSDIPRHVETEAPAVVDFTDDEHGV